MHWEGYFGAHLAFVAFVVRCILTKEECSSAQSIERWGVEAFVPVLSDLALASDREIVAASTTIIIITEHHPTSDLPMRYSEVRDNLIEGSLLQRQGGAAVWSRE